MFKTAAERHYVKEKVDTHKMAEAMKHSLLWVKFIRSI
jgi:hypothetical protein